ncbi:MAG: ABC transporter substrate-binding protein, partial [Candidatus Fimadaptatus sp.]
MKKLVSLILTVVLALSMGTIACAGAQAEGETVKLTWAMGTGDVAPIDNAMVLEELNKMSSELIGVECDIQYFQNDQLLISIQSGEVFDIYFTCSWYNNFNQAVSQGLFANLDGKVQEMAPDLYASMTEDVWELAHSSDGGLYAIPVKKDYAMMNFITYPADKAAELGFEIPDRITAWSDLTDFLVAWKATLADNEYPVLIGGNPAGMESSFDFIDRTAMIGCIFGTTDVVTVFDDPEVMERYRTMADWYKLGLVNPDAAQLNESSIDTTKERIGFVQAWPGYDYSVSNGYNTDMTCFFGPNLSTDGVQGSMNALSVTLEEDEARMAAALKYIELCHTNKLFNDTMRYGVQGYHWNYVTEEQSAACAGGVLRTEVGTSNYTPWGFSQPAYFETSIAVSQEQV